MLSIFNLAVQNLKDLYKATFPIKGKMQFVMFNWVNIFRYLHLPSTFGKGGAA